MSDATPDDVIAVPVVWVGLEDMPVLMANQFIFQTVGPDEVVATVGQLVPPPLLGTPEEQQSQAAQIEYVGVKPMIRIALNERRLQELLKVVQETIANLNRRREARSEHG